MRELDSRGDRRVALSAVRARPRRGASPFILLTTLLSLALSATSALAEGTLESVRVAPDGRLLRITLSTSAPIQAYTLARQGPPEKRDLVVRFPGMRDATQGPVDTGDYILEVGIAREESAGGELKLTFARAGDSLVSVAHDGARLSLVIIPPEKRSEAADAYRLGVNDTLQLDVFGHEDLNKTLKVSPQGSVNVPLIGAVKAEGRTVDEVAQEITERLGADYLRDPRVSVSVWEYLSQWVNVIGEVAQPGRYPLTGPTTLIDALSLAGGLTPKAAGEITVTRRPEEVDPSSAGEIFRVDVTALLAGEPRLNLRLRPGDVILVRGSAAPAAPSGEAPRP
jgi:polysaccharide export outer membrane protein